MGREEYYAECIEIAANDIGLSLTAEQINYLADAVCGSIENESMAFGRDVASANYHAREKREQDEVKQRLRYEQEVPRVRCNSCSGHGFTRDGWGREFGCSDCHGKGSTALYTFQYSPPKKETA